MTKNNLLSYTKGSNKNGCPIDHGTGRKKKGDKMKKNNKKETKTLPINKVAFTLYAFESEEKKNCTLVRASLNNGKDKDGDYKPSTPITVIITKDTDNQLLSDDELTGEINDKIYVEGSLTVEYNETKKGKYTNIKIFATSICPFENA